MNQRSEMKNQKTGLTTGIILLFATAVGLILNFAIPPFQNPDEPLRFSYMVRNAWGDESRAEVESGILRLMDRYNWWRSVGMEAPKKIPDKFINVPYLVFGYKGEDVKYLSRGLSLYNYAAAKILKPFAGKNLLLFYYLARLFSYILLVAALLILRSGYIRIFVNEMPCVFVLFMPALFII